ncbi:hypothetical protein PG991_013362 [Apiospora marii]|uniref:Uncharacterized protein n=1 Tax=Apiospora marii TaxID=335849 RepID=A0ABR1R6N4_9PEZI
MGNGPQLLYYPPDDLNQSNYELPPTGGQRPRDSSQLSQTPGSHYNPQQSSADGSLPLHFPSSPPRLSEPMNPSSSPPYNGGFPFSSQQTNPVATPSPNTSSQASGSNRPAPPLPYSSGLFVPETSPFNPFQFSALSSSRSQTPHNPNLEIHSPAPNAPLSAPSILIPPALRDLQARLNHDRRSFQPVQSRDLRVDERGYWVVHTSNWTPQQWLATWTHLTEFVGGGTRAGPSACGARGTGPRCGSIALGLWSSTSGGCCFRRPRGAPW